MTWTCKRDVALDWCHDEIGAELSCARPILSESSLM